MTLARAQALATRRYFRGLTRRYDPARVGSDRRSGTDFTDCPYTALRYAAGRAGVLLVVDVPERNARVTEELWLDGGARRFMIWGAFDAFIVATIPAKELRAEVRRAGVAGLPDEDKAMVLRSRLDERLGRPGAARTT